MKRVKRIFKRSLSVSHDRDHNLSASDGGLPSNSLRRHRSWGKNDNCNLEETGRRLASHSDDESQIEDTLARFKKYKSKKDESAKEVMSVGLESTTVAVPTVAAQLSPQISTTKEHLNSTHDSKPDIIISTPPNMKSPRPSLVLSEHLSSDLDMGDVDVDRPNGSAVDIQASGKYYDDMISRINQQLAKAVEKGQSPYSIYGMEENDEEDWC